MAEAPLTRTRPPGEGIHDFHLHPKRRVLYTAERSHAYPEALWNRFNGGKDGTLWYYRALVETFRQVGACGMMEELDRVVSELERVAAAIP